MENGRLVLVYNPVSGNWAARTPIVFAVSDDNGTTWGQPNILDHLPCDYNEESAEFSYPAIVAKGNDVFISYTWKRQTVAFWHIRFLSE
jgi:predicted neuraminidase